MDELARFCQRLLRFDPAALVRVQNNVAWAKLPWDVYVCVQTTVPDGEIAAAEAKPVTGQWRGSLPPLSLPIVEVVPATVIHDVAEAAARTFKEMTGRAGERAIRDALLDHVVIQGTSDVDGTPFSVPQRLVQAITRMGLAGDGEVQIRAAGAWTALTTARGAAFYRRGNPLAIRPIVNHLNGR